MRILLMGGTGLVGSRLVQRLLGRGDKLVLLTRRADHARTRWPACEVVSGDPKEAGAWLETVPTCDAVINLTGEGIFNHRWTTKFKQELYDSRIKSTQNVASALGKNPRTAGGAPRVLVNASAIGYYGPHGDEELDESSLPGSDFLAKLCVDWEKAAMSAADKGARVAIVRVGVVLDSEGGALVQMSTPFKLFMGGPTGSGKQYISWIHHVDMTGIFLLALDKAAATGPIDGTAPQPVTNKDFTQALGKAMHRPSFMPTPALAVRAALGEVATLVTSGQRVLPRRAKELGFAFKFSDVQSALRDLFPEPLPEDQINSTPGSPSTTSPMG
jgi:uncharacterized protein (TIGR01777 family)